MKLVDLQEVSLSYGRIQALDRVSFQLESGETLGLLGENGAGKTTCLRILAGLLLPDQGRVRISGRDLYPEPQRMARRLGFMPTGLPPDQRVVETLDFRARLCGFSGRRRTTEVERLVTLCQAGDFARRFNGTLSTGMRQRVALAWALCGEPDLILLDEPSFGLDPRQQMSLREIIAAAAEKSAVIVSSHGLDELARIAGRFLVLHHGRVLHDGPAPGPLLEFFLDLTGEGSPMEGTAAHDMNTAGDAS
ncbi:MAG: ABC transporter ATP-binding protein [Deltaproteobacteria bacterium HGW-Deltaproteobacteria-22]|jgi:ABC-2 type transport system ATP-binding protein|nr:MAG: ABC transporter ATP-binding protein [Deltaproteobacteria bacterium HGW-Deltaproteobacteria-22]